MLNLNETVFAFDTETYGLRSFSGDLPFGFAISDSVNDIYLDDRHDPKQLILSLCKEIFENEKNTVIIHNAKFDMHMLNNWSLLNFGYEFEFKAKILCTAVLARIANNQRISCTLEDVAMSFGYEKDLTVKKWITRNKAYKLFTRADGSVEKEPDYSLVPYFMISSYAKKDARICYEIYPRLLQQISMLDLYLKTLTVKRSIWDIIEREAKFTKTLYHLEKTGVLVDSASTERNFQIERQRYTAAAERYKSITGREFVDSGANHEASLDALGLSKEGAARTATGAISFSKQNIDSIDSTVSQPIKEYREAHKKANTVLLGLLDARDPAGRIHTNFGQHTTRTFRLSSTNPNLQNISKKEDGDGNNLRDSFVPDPDCYIVAIDYKAQEMRLLFDFSGQEDVAARIMAGEDTHDVTSKLMDISRKHAKTIGFGLVYGMGLKKLAHDLGMNEENPDDIKEAKRLKKLFRDSMPKAGSFIYKIIEKAEKGYIANPWGRVFQFTPDYAYKAVNYLIQSSGAEIMRDAMNALHDYYFGNPYVRMVLTVHDEIVFCIHKDHMHEVENIKNIMRSAYKPNILPMDVDAKISMESWGKCG